LNLRFVKWINTIISIIRPQRIIWARGENATNHIVEIFP